MALPLLIPVAIGLGGMFVGSQIDDAIEKPTVQATDPSTKITTFTVVKVLAFTGASLFLYNYARKSGLLK